MDVSRQRPEDVSNSVRQLIQGIEYSNNTLANSQLRYILSRYDPKVWANVLLKITSEAYPPFVDVAVSKEALDLTAAYMQHGAGSEPVESLMKELVNPLNKLSFTSFTALGELAAMLRDSCGDPSKVASHLGPRVFASSQETAQMHKEAVFMFQVMVERCEDMFGQGSSKVSALDTFGVRKIDRVQDGVNWDLDVLMPGSYKQKKDLKSFYERLDPKYVQIVDDLLTFHQLKDVAEGIYKKYKMIPAGWKEELTRQKQAGERIDWFNPSTVATPKGGQKGTPAGIERNPSIPKGTRTSADQIIDAFINGEIQYYRQMNALGKHYVFFLNDIARGTSPTKSDGALSLGLSSGACDFLFGQPWQQIMEFTHGMLVSLEVVNLVRTSPVKPYSREGITADVLSELMPARMLYAYHDFYVTAVKSDNLLKTSIEAAKKLQVRPGCVNFVQLWEQVRSQHKVVSRFSLEDIMSLPINRINTYRSIISNLLADAQSQRNQQLIAKLNKTSQRFAKVDEGLRQAHLTGQYD